MPSLSAHNKSTIQEARHCLGPTIGVIDSNSDPDWVDYVVPGNDDSLSALTFYAQAFAGALAEGRLAAEEEGKKRAGAGAHAPRPRESQHYAASA
jgi:small subunit ribosomal protein S2